MRKSLWIATALAAMSVAGNAMALDVSRARVLQVDGLQGANLGALDFTPLGADGEFCDYLANWRSPFNPNDVVICVLQELRTPFAPSCIDNERADFTTLVGSASASDIAGGSETGNGGACGGESGGGQGGQAGITSACSGFNLKGESYQNVSVTLNECEGGLSGLVIIPSGGAPQIYPVRTGA